MEAVHIQTSMANQMEHHSSPKIQISKISHVAEKGRTARPTMRSATASDTINKFVTVRNFVLMNTARMTRQFPTITTMLMNARMRREARTFASFQLSKSRSSSHDTFKYCSSSAGLFIISPPFLFYHSPSKDNSICLPEEHITPFPLMASWLFLVSFPFLITIKDADAPDGSGGGDDDDDDVVHE